ncbi:MAG TPA: MFS transporter [Nostocaceae cyanobacterium]|nr:MFS transporter [Nostocaceae cyanobacterium]
MIPNEPAVVNKGFGSLLKNRNFMLLWIGQLISQMADKIFLILTIDLLSVYLLNTQIPEEEGRFYLYAVSTIPAILFGSIGGVIVDRMPKKPIMVGSDFIRGLLTLCLPFLPREFQVMLIVVFTISTVTQFFAPAEQAVIPMLVKRESLMAANALFASTMMAALIVANATGHSLLLWAKSISYSFGGELVVGGCYLLSALVMMPIYFKEHKHRDQETAVPNPWTEFVQGWRYLKKNRLVWNAMVQIVALYSVFAALLELSIRLAIKFHEQMQQLQIISPEESDKQLGYTFFIAATGIGMVLGAGILGQFGYKLHRKPLPLIGFSIMAVALCLFTVIPNLPLALGLCVFLGMGAAFVNVPMQTLIQQNTPPAMHGKVFGFQNHAVNIALSAPLLITTKLVDQLGLSIVLLGMSLLVASVGVWAWRSSRSVLQDSI